VSAPPRPARERVDGVLLLDKPVGLSSNAALQRAKRALNAAKAGHPGTLDPLASGLLPLCFGEATKFAQVLLDAPKRYTSTIRFGSTTTTGDAEGEVLETRPVALSEAQIEAALPLFRGAIEQVPPAFAALKYHGRTYYEYARAGIDIPRAPRGVEIHTLELVTWNAPDAVVDIACSKGTYVRALAADLGAALGPGAHLACLRRTMRAGVTLDDALTLEAFEALPAAARRERLLGADAPLAGLPRLDLDARAAADLLQGREVASTAGTGRFRAYAPEGRFVGLVDCVAGRVQAVRLVATQSGPRPTVPGAMDIGD
jgi:tRNA pseudouridine55 synthase